MSDKVKIMIVEDESIVALDLSMRLQKEGYDMVGIASNSDDAINIFTEQKPDLVLMDINIKGHKDGIETAAALKKIQDVPLIFLTAFSQNEYVTRAKTVNPSAYLVKPFNNDSLHTSIQIAIHNFAILPKPTDPVCRYSPHHETVVAARDQARTDEFVHRTMKRPRLAERA